MGFPDNFIKWIKKECNNDETCVMIAFILIGLLLCFLFKDQISGFANEYASVELTKESESIPGEGEDPKKAYKTESTVGLELRPPQRSKSALDDKLKIMDTKPKIQRDSKFQRAGLNIQDSMIARPFDEVWNPGFMPLDMVFKGASVDKKQPLGPMGPDRPMRPEGVNGTPLPASDDSQVGATAQVTGSQKAVSDDLKVILLYAPWCGHSKKMLPDYERVKSEFDGQTVNGKQVSIIMYNSDVDKDKVKDYEVKGFPTLFVEENGVRKPFPHRTYDKIVEYIKGN